jgi:hypothetical protein
VLGDPALAGSVVAQWGIELAVANAKRPEDGADAVPDPYHTLEECLLRQLDVDDAQSRERFSGRAYTSHIAIEWLARRKYRARVEHLWPLSSRLVFCEFRTNKASDVLARQTDDGKLVTWVAPYTASWTKICEDASQVGELELPAVLWRRLEWLPFLGLVFPYRFTSSAAKALDYLTRPALCSVIPDSRFTSTPSNWGPATAPGQAADNRGSA